MQGVRQKHWGFFGAWWILLLCGYVYVAGVLCQRDNPFHSGNLGVGDFSLVALLGPLFFYLGPRHNWIPIKSSTFALLNQNVLCYVLTFFLALHWNSFGSLVGANFSLKPSDLSTLDSQSQAILAIGSVLIAGLLACHLRWASRAGIIRAYATALVAIPVLIGLITLVLKDSHYVHIHHYFVGAFLFPFFRFRNAISLAAQAIFLGLAVEGISRWGADSIWYPLIP